MGKKCKNCYSAKVIFGEPCRSCHDRSNWKPKEEERTCVNCYYEADLLDSEGNCAECVSHYTNWKPKEKELKMKYKIVGQEIPKEDVKGVELEYGSNGKVEVLVNGFCVVCLNKNGTQYRPHNAQGSGMDTDSAGRVKLEGE